DGIRDFHVTGVQTCALPIYSGAGGPHTRGREGPSRRRPVARDLRGTVFGFQVVIGSWPKFYLNLALGASYAYMPFSSPTPICRFRILRPYAVFESYAYTALTAPIHRCYSEESHTEGRRPCPPSRSSCSTA